MVGGSIKQFWTDKYQIDVMEFAQGDEALVFGREFTGKKKRSSDSLR